MKWIIVLIIVGIGGLSFFYLFNQDAKMQMNNLGREILNTGLNRVITPQNQTNNIYTLFSQTGSETMFNVDINGNELCMNATVDLNDYLEYGNTMLFEKNGEEQNPLLFQVTNLGGGLYYVETCYTANPETDDYFKFGYDSIVIIKITSALHLDENRSFVADIYEYVNESDDIVYTIPNDDYMRAVFETNLTHFNRIDIEVENSNNSEVYLYEKDNDTIIANATITNNSGVFYLYPNHTGKQDTFDLKSIGNVTYDYIVDPPEPLLEDINISASDYDIENGDLVNITVFYDNTGSGSFDGSVWFSSGALNGKSGTNTRINGNCTDVDEDNYYGDNFRILDITVDCEGTCTFNLTTGALYLDIGVSDNYNKIIWQLQACSYGDYNSPYNIITEPASPNTDLDDATNDITVNYTDVVFPNITFDSSTPANASSQSSTTLNVNVTAEDELYNVSSFINFDKSIIGWWRMDDLNASGDVEDYFGKLNASIYRGANGDAHQTDAGYLGKSFILDGYADYLIIPNATTILKSNATIMNETLSIWAKRHGKNNANTNEGIFGVCGWISGCGYQQPLIIMSNSSTLFCRGYYEGGSIYTYADTNDFPDYKWTLTTCTTEYNGTAVNMSFYVDGELKDSDTLTTLGYLRDRGHYLIGVENMAQNRWFNGSVDDIIVFNKTLNYEEIEALYNSQNPRYLDINYTNLEYDNYTFTGYTQDRGGNVNVTEERTVTIEEPATVCAASGDCTIDCSSTSSITSAETVNQNLIFNNAGRLEITANFTFEDENPIIQGETGCILDIARGVEWLED